MESEMVHLIDKLLSHIGGGGTGVVSGIVVLFAFNVGINFANFLHMRKSMVTKKDMQIALLEFNKTIESHYMTRKDCELIHQLAEGKAGIKSNGGNRREHREV